MGTREGGGNRGWRLLNRSDTFLTAPAVYGSPPSLSLEFKDQGNKKSICRPVAFPDCSHLSVEM